MGVHETFDAVCEIAEVMLPMGGIVTVLHHAYFDESGTHDGSSVMTLAGYLFTSDQARKFSRDWTNDLERIGISCAHMTDCALGFGEYKNLTLEERINSERLLIGHIKRRSMFGFAVSVSPQAYDEILSGFPGAPSPYSTL